MQAEALVYPMFIKEAKGSVERRTDLWTKA